MGKSLCATDFIPQVKHLTPKQFHAQPLTIQAEPAIMLEKKIDYAPFDRFRESMGKDFYDLFDKLRRLDVHARKHLFFSVINEPPSVDIWTVLILVATVGGQEGFEWFSEEVPLQARVDLALSAQKQNPAFVHKHLLAYLGITEDMLAENCTCQMAGGAA